MGKRPTLSEVIAKLEAASAGSSGLDMAITDALFADPRDMPDSDPRCVGYKHYAGHYTTSLDAALTLVPEGHDWSLQRYEGEIEADVESGTIREDCQGSGKPPALSLCIASLKARQATTSPDPQS